MYTFQHALVHRGGKRDRRRQPLSVRRRHPALTAGTFPVGTLVVNVTGSFLLGVILRYGVETPTLTPEVRAFLTVGFCGGYTTFSTFSYETVALMEDGQWPRAALYVAAERRPLAARDVPRLRRGARADRRPGSSHEMMDDAVEERRCTA